MKTLYSILVVALVGSNVYAQKINNIDEKGRKQGLWKKYYPDSTLYAVGNFKDGIPIDTFKYFYQNANLKAIIVHKKDSITYAQYFYPDGKILKATGKYVNQKKDSTWTYYKDNGKKLAVEYYILGKPYGKWEVFFENGLTAEEKNYERGLENGEWKQYYIDGTLSMKSVYKDGFLNGHSVYYDDDAKIIAEGDYVNDLREGEWFYYNKDGSVKYKVLYKKGIILSKDIREEPIDTSKYEKKDILEFEDLIEDNPKKEIYSPRYE